MVQRRPGVTASEPWDQADLVRRVHLSLDLATGALDLIGSGRRPDVIRDSTEGGGPRFSSEKLVGETAMLLLCAMPLRRHDIDIADRIEALAARLVPLARQADILAAICSDPGLARDYALPHAVLSHIGYGDPSVDVLLSASLSIAPRFGPERLPNRRLEQEWLDRTWTSGASRPLPERGLIGRTMLGRPIDALGSTRLDLYAFTHAVMYATDFGARRPALPRSRRAIAADADAGLAFSLDTDDFDLTAELCLTWPMLGMSWSRTSAFAFRILASIEDEYGFVPGAAFDAAHHASLTDPDKRDYTLVTSYHASYTMGFLCAAAATRGAPPPKALPPVRGRRGAAAALMALIGANGGEPNWARRAGGLSQSQQDAIAPLMLIAVLRRAKTSGDLGLVREALDAAVRHNLLDGPAPGQAAALLRRAIALEVATQRFRGRNGSP